ncbi:MAG: DegV family protein [Ruminococcus sp.]|nr:DegV family protein [Ruminococcus sp.]
MGKTVILTDAACDISKEQEHELGIKIVPFKVAVGDKSYLPRVDIDNFEFYKVMDAYEGIPATSQVTTLDWFEAYEKLAQDKEVTDIINVTISSHGSATYNNAVIAKKDFFSKYKEREKDLNIHVIDSDNYTGVYGYAVVQAAIKANSGVPATQIIAFINDWLKSAYVLFACYNLKYAKKSGRISAAAAFAGELLGLKPILKISHGVSSILKKVRGEKAIIPTILEIAKDDMIPKTPYVIIWGSDETLKNDIAKAMEKAVGYPPTDYIQVGAAVACNAGHRVAGVVIKGNSE